MRRAPKDGTTTEAGAQTHYIPSFKVDIDRLLAITTGHQDDIVIRTTIILGEITGTGKMGSIKGKERTNHTRPSTGSSNTPTTTTAKTLKPPPPSPPPASSTSRTRTPRTHLPLLPSTTTALARAPGDLTRTHVAGITHEEDPDTDAASTVLARGPGDLTRSHVHGVVVAAAGPDSSQLAGFHARLRRFLLVDQGSGLGSGAVGGRADLDSESESESESEVEFSSGSGSEASSSSATASTSDSSTRGSSSERSSSSAWYNSTSVTDEMVREILMQEAREEREQMRFGW
ncbi:hypothetical protein F4775DRAFT_589254 [Biscogniauxia sp. FL1348]|nr:hypothetical protein F4775DRAFT_589254 [Biscogniauxia sp. FL1348]